MLKIYHKKLLIMIVVLNLLFIPLTISVNAAAIEKNYTCVQGFAYFSTPNPEIHITNSSSTTSDAEQYNNVVSDKSVPQNNFVKTIKHCLDKIEMFLHINN